MNKTHYGLVVFGLSLLILAGCASSSTAPKAIPPPQTNEENKLLIGNQVILAEIARLTNLNLEKKITLEDLETLEGWVKSDEDAADELHEIETLIKYKEYTHVGHGLSFFDSYIRTGKHLLCPGHALAHYYVFMRNGEEELAEEGLEEAEEQYPEWLPIARNYDAQFPGPVSFNQIDQTIKNHLEAIEQGDSMATEDEINFLANEGSICVEGTEEHD